MLFLDLDFGGVLERFWEGLGRLKTSIFAIFSCFFQCDFRSAFRKAKKSTKKANNKQISALLAQDCGATPPAGRDDREGSRSAKEVQTILGEDRISISSLARFAPPTVGRRIASRMPPGHDRGKNGQGNDNHMDFVSRLLIFMALLFPTIQNR